MFSGLQGSIQLKIIATITLVFLLILGTSLAFVGHGERTIMADIAEHRARDHGRTYFDGVNTMMLTGTLDQKDVLRKKLESLDGVTEISLIRHPVNMPASGTGPAGPVGELEQAALSGKEAVEFGRDRDGRTVTAVTPIVASRNYHGTDCLSCHDVPEGSIMGAIRVTYSLKELDDVVTGNLRLNGLLNLVLFALGVGFIYLLIRVIVIAPILQLRKYMARVVADSDLTLQSGIRTRDEIGVLVEAIEGMLGQFRASMTRVAETSGRLLASAQDIKNASEQTASGTQSQLSETTQTVAIISDLNSLAHAVDASATDTAHASVETERQAVQGASMTREAIAGIRALVDDMRQTSETMERLEERSRNVNSVLDVIRGIAEQTNLLALNAAIEAARAGEMGRGFAVVADEVRKLATMSQSATTNIEEILSELQREAREAVNGANRSQESAEHRSQQLHSAIDSLDRIVSRVTDIRNLNSQMAMSLDQQKRLTESAQEKVTAISRITSHTEAQAVNTQGVGIKLAALAGELDSLVARFKLV